MDLRKRSRKTSAPPFTYGWSGGNQVAAAFSAVNESTWEHLKLFFFPLLLFSVVQLCVMGRNYPNFLSARALSALTGLVLIPVLFYTYTGVLGRDVLWADLAIFGLSALAAVAVDWFLLRRGRATPLWGQVVGLLVLWALAFSMIYFTFRPPELPLFRDPVTHSYGVSP